MKPNFFRIQLNGAILLSICAFTFTKPTSITDTKVSVQTVISSGFQETTRSVFSLPKPVHFSSCNPDSRALKKSDIAPFPIGEYPFAAPEPKPSLRMLAEAKDRYIGAAVSPYYFADPAYARQLGQQFNMIAAENSLKWDVVHPEPNVYDFSQGDAMVAFARAKNMQIFAHVLVWDLQMPTWVTEGKHSRSEWIQILCTHIKTVVGHYRGQIYAWDVVNEAVNKDGTLRNTFWMQKIGPEHIAMAFQWAREADPYARLFYNDFDGEGLNTKSQAIYMLVRSLRENGIPIDGVGLQMHVALYKTPTPQELKSNMARLADLGLEVDITEMDIRLQLSKEPDQVKLAAQAETYRQVISVCLQVENCRAFITWGLSDRFSWIPGYTGHPDAPLLFDQDGAPKPAYWAVQKQLAKK
jgi:endo-1,4-beta-xylanase